MIIQEKIVFFAIEKFQYISQAPSLTLSSYVIYVSCTENAGHVVAATHGNSQCQS